jgi:DNA polymerase-3 subunit epsilon
LQPPKPIPPAVQRITGISDTAMTRAVSQETAWRRLIKTAKAIAAENQTALCPTVIHYARFEAPFLRELHHTIDPQAPFPFQLICTHAIAVRLLPDLPRRGIRALAGYLGHSMSEFKRSADHALATAVIWKAMVALLQTRCSVSSLQQLMDWLAVTHPPRRTQREFPMNPKTRLSLPDEPGIYRMRRANDDILYIGKAKSLKQRVNSYFRQHAAHPEHILEMLSQAWNLDFFPTASALEAAVLESDEIKHHRPPYNIALRPGQRSLVFCTRDLKQHSARCDEHFCIGPLPAGRLIDALTAFESWRGNDMRLAGDYAACIGYPALGLRATDRPEFECLQAGFDLFRLDHLSRLQNRSALRVVTLLGAELWRERLKTITNAQPAADRGSGCDDAPAEEIEASLREHPWTPDRVAGALEDLMMRSAHLLRRARWFCLLSESCLAWASAADPHRLKNLLIFEKGDIGYRGAIEAGQKIPDPPDLNRSWHERRKNLDLVTYDRMRVVTTELRRLIGEGRKIELRLGPKVPLTSRELKKALQWV